MSRKIRIAAAQMGPVHLRDSREHCVTRMIEMMREAHATGCKVIVFPELALSTFFARHWMETLSTQGIPVAEKCKQSNLQIYLKKQKNWV